MPNEAGGALRSGDSTGEWPTLVRIAVGHIQLSRGALRHDVRGGMSEHMACTYEELAAKDQASADLYLMGIVDGLAHGVFEQFEDMIRRGQVKDEGRGPFDRMRLGSLRIRVPAAPGGFDVT